MIIISAIRTRAPPFQGRECSRPIRGRELIARLLPILVTRPQPHPNWCIPPMRASPPNACIPPMGAFWMDPWLASPSQICCTQHCENRHMRHLLCLSARGIPILSGSDQTPRDWPQDPWAQEQFQKPRQVRKLGDSVSFPNLQEFQLVISGNHRKFGKSSKLSAYLVHRQAI